MIVEDGYDSAPSERLKYPHHKIKNGELVVDRAGVIAAFQRASQQGIVNGKVKSHLLKHYRELGLSTENFEEKEGQAEMNDDEMKKLSAESEEANNEEKVDMECIPEEIMEEKKDVEMAKDAEEDNKEEGNKEEEKEENNDEDDKEEVDYEAKIVEYEAKIAEMEQEKDSYMSELENLRQYKADKEEAEKNFAIEEIFSQVSEVLPQDKMDELREEAKEVKFEAVDVFKNKVKAIAFEYTSKKDVKSNRMAIVNEEKTKDRKAFDRFN